MATTANPIRPGPAVRLKKHPVKLTALLYLRAALAEEKYEECADMINVAREFGATAVEIQYLLEDPRRTPNG